MPVEVPLLSDRLQQYDRYTTDECVEPRIRPRINEIVREKFGNSKQSYDKRTQKIKNKKINQAHTLSYVQNSF